MQFVAVEAFEGVTSREPFGEVDVAKDSAPCSASEGIDRIPRRRCAQMRLQGLAIDHFNPFVEQAGNVIFQSDVIE
jgi:hypothetical protein